ncbi:helix-turn-helix domain-containing protein [Lactobacillus iners]|uniref:helix-turn-helix domain-containing protein n=1 Tax=Lactobacillus iners TaxID=147802 RepID=UPI003EBEEFF5
MGISRAQLYKMRVNPMVMGIDHMESLARILDCSFSDIYSIRKKFRKEVDKNVTSNKKMTSVLWTPPIEEKE